MNDQTTNHDLPELPELSEATISRIETAVFGEIEDDRPSADPRAGRARARRRGWLTGAGVAAAFALGVLVTPPILGAVAGSATSTADGGAVYDTGVASDESAGSKTMSGGTPELAPGALTGDPDATSASDAGREIIATANATVRVKDVADAADEIATLAEKHGGFVESTEVGKSVAIDGTSEPAPPDSGYGWISIRVPSSDLTTVMDALGDSGEVLSSSISKQDVTSTAIDLRARVDATKASVQRLTELMAQSGSVSELIEAEVALTDRQAQLESYEQQLADLEDQVAMSTLQVQLTRTERVTADPAGFGDGLAAGWKGLIVSLNALVIALGFVLPWLAVIGVAALIVWLIVRARRSRRSSTVARTDIEDDDLDA
ncbi:DUF4349 domain-containing protein [Streptomyces sp. AC495_CC817]|uniref:DUF4349 domain-containing protein n=1 Tax=Streptomyces sp. AC495_CC817 TaxID=2823900 RepID=UPI001C27DD84|nr:DUF4349 domain-containing protein [Streptomyces sp. AC495_CC817]